MKTIKEMVDVMRAADRGDAIQYKYGTIWHDCDTCPEWDWPRVDYRVKPNPLECWIVVRNGEFLGIFNSQTRAIESQNTWGGTIHHMREVIE